jgi:SAM-dependent methyltransferase
MLCLSRRSTAALALFFLAGADVLAASDAPAPPRTREDCQAAHPAAWGQAGKDVPWVPTFDAVTLTMLTMAQVTPQDRVLDLGAGDGRIAIAAAKPPFGARAVGIEYDAELAGLATCLVRVDGVADRVRIVQGDIFKEDFGQPSVVTLFLLPQINLCVRHRLLALAPGTRVVSHQYPMADWTPDQSVKVQGRDVFLWVVPARVDGVWDFRDSEGASLTVDLRQAFGSLSGEVTRVGATQPLRSATLHGADLRFAFDTAGVASRFSGTVRGTEITGVLFSGNVARTVVGRLRGALRVAPWAAMPSDCRSHYTGPGAP